MATAGRLLPRPRIRLTFSANLDINVPISSWVREKCTDNGRKGLPPVSIPASGRNQISHIISAVQSPPLISLIPTSNQVADVLPLPGLWPNLLTEWISTSRMPQFSIPTPAQTQMLIQRSVVDCRFFTLLAVAGSLIGSILCFLEGFCMVVNSYIKYFHALSHRLDLSCVIHQLIEAIDMFLLGTAMIVFAMGMYTMFIEPSSSNRIRQAQLPHSNLFGLFPLKTMPSGIEVDSLSQAKSRIGHAVMLILQVGVLEKFKSVPLNTGLDLAYFAGAIVFSSASIFVLSKLSKIKINKL